MKLKIFLAIIAGFLVANSSSEAAKIDTYRDAIANKSFAIKYEIVTTPVRRSNRELSVKPMKLFKSLEFEDSTIDNSVEQNGIFAINGNDKYSEYQMREGDNPCRLINDGDTTVFRYIIKDGKKQYKNLRLEEPKPKVLYAEARLIEGLSIENPTEISNLIADIMAK